MTQKFNPFAFDFNSVSVDGNAIDDFPYDTPLVATVSDVAYKNLAKKGSGEEKIRLVISQIVYSDDKEGKYDTIISPNQAYLLKSYMQAVGVDANELSNQALDEDGLRDTFSGASIMLTFQEREWQGKKYRNVQRVSPFVDASAVADGTPPW